MGGQTGPEYEYSVPLSDNSSGYDLSASNLNKVITRLLSCCSEYKKVLITPAKISACNKRYNKTKRTH